MKDPRTFIGIILVACAIGLFAFLQMSEKKNPVPEVLQEKKIRMDEVPIIATQGAAIGKENEVSFTCAGRKSLSAVFERDIVGITLSDGRRMTLRLAPSDTGIRYLSPDANIVFSGRGNEGELTEGGVPTYESCKGPGVTSF